MMPILAWAWVFTLPGLLLTALGVPGNRKGAGYASLAGPVVLLLVAVVALIQGGSFTVVFPNWLPFLPYGAFQTLADTLSALMLAIVGFVATLVYIYSLGYMADDPGRRRFFVFLDLFVASMVLLVLAGDLAVLLIGWTLVGLSSFLLISFWRDKPGTLGAGLQALAANAIGDGALLLAASTVPSGCGTLVTLSTPQCTGGLGGVEFLALLLFVAAAAKSAQGPLYFWLPNAMAGPTPISALIHAATMVAAGVYLLARTYAVLTAAPQVSFWIAVIGVATAIGASVAALFMSNFKKGIAYSTIAQLGYMFTAIGVSASFAGLFHLFTHASFKALLFLAAGIVIHGASGHEELSDLRGLGRFFPFSRWGFLIGSLALIGTPLITSGGFSKDDILEAVIAAQPVLGWLLVLAVTLTGAYIGRLFAIVYMAPADDPHAVHHDASAERPMNWSLVPLMVGSIVLGWTGDWLAVALTGPLGSFQPPPGPLTVVGGIAFILGAVGFLGAAWYVLRPQMVLPATLTSYRPDRWVRAIADGGYAVAGAVSRAQTGLLAMYASVMLLAVAIILLLRIGLR
jgi:NADH-quinone oxidoreductase subunit L